MSGDENANTEYGSWNSVDPTTLTAAHSAMELLGSYASDYDSEALGDAYAAAIKAALPVSVDMSGGIFYGPWRPAPDAWDGYPTVEGNLDIKAIVEGIDFWRLARAYEYGATLYVTVEAGAVDGANPPIWQLVTDIERVDQDGEDAAQLTAQQLADFTAGNQTVARGDLWRVRVWNGPDEYGTPNLTPLAEHLHDTRNV